MSKKTKILFFILFVALLMPNFVLAAPYTANDSQALLGEAVSKTGVTETDITTVGGYVLKNALRLVGIVFFIIIFYGGFVWLLAKGNEEQIKKAQNTIIGSIIGLMVVLGAYGITILISQRVIKGELQKDKSDNIPVAEEGDPVGCCLDRWETEGGYFGVGQSGWTGEILTKAQCDALNAVKDYPTQNIKADDGQWTEGAEYTTEQCQNLAKERADASEWQQSSKWDGMGKKADEALDFGE